MRSKESTELLKDPLAFTLLAVIAKRAKRTEDFNAHGLKVGEALIGDYKNYGMTRKQYRTRLNRLRKWGFAATRRATSGTIARLLDKRVYDINQELRGHQDGQSRAITGPQSRSNKKFKEDTPLYHKAFK